MPPACWSLNAGGGGQPRARQLPPSRRFKHYLRNNLPLPVILTRISLSRSCPRFHWELGLGAEEETFTKNHQKLQELDRKWRFHACMNAADLRQIKADYLSSLLRGFWDPKFWSVRLEFHRWEFW